MQLSTRHVRSKYCSTSADVKITAATWSAICENLMLSNNDEVAASGAVKATAKILYEQTNGAGKQTDEMRVHEAIESDREAESAGDDPGAEGSLGQEPETDVVTHKRLLTKQKRRTQTRSVRVSKKRRKP